MAGLFSRQPSYIGLACRVVNLLRQHALPHPVWMSSSLPSPHLLFSRTPVDCRCISLMLELLASGQCQQSFLKILSSLKYCYVIWLCVVECADPPGQLCELSSFIVVLLTAEPVCPSLKSDWLVLGVVVLQFVAGDTWLNKIRRFYSCVGDVLGLGWNSAMFRL